VRVGGDQGRHHPLRQPDALAGAGVEHPLAVRRAQLDDQAAGRRRPGHVHGDRPARPEQPAAAVERGRFGVGGVEDHEVAGAQRAGQVAERQVPQRPLGLGDQQPHLVAGQPAGLRRLDRGQLRGDGEGGLHAAPPTSRSAAR
jgi:hypothetical protein